MGDLVLKVLVIYLITVNLIAFFMYGADKAKAKKNKWRIAEKTLIGIAVIGGSVGAIAGMKVFRHKTKHWYFKYGLPAILLVQIAVSAWVVCKFI